jgi:hypothetical protein
LSSRASALAFVVALVSRHGFMVAVDLLTSLGTPMTIMLNHSIVPARDK